MDPATTPHTTEDKFLSLNQRVSNRRMFAGALGLRLRSNVPQEDDNPQYKEFRKEQRHHQETAEKALVMRLNRAPHEVKRFIDEMFRIDDMLRYDLKHVMAGTTQEQRRNALSYLEKMVVVNEKRIEQLLASDIYKAIIADDILSDGGACETFLRENFGEQSFDDDIPGEGYTVAWGAQVLWDSMERMGDFATLQKYAALPRSEWYADVKRSMAHIRIALDKVDTAVKKDLREELLATLVGDLAALHYRKFIDQGPSFHRSEKWIRTGGVFWYELPDNLVTLALEQHLPRLVKAVTDGNLRGLVKLCGSSELDPLYYTEAVTSAYDRLFPSEGKPHLRLRSLVEVLTDTPSDNRVSLLVTISERPDAVEFATKLKRYGVNLVKAVQVATSSETAGILPSLTAIADVPRLASNAASIINCLDTFNSLGLTQRILEVSQTAQEAHRFFNAVIDAAKVGRNDVVNDALLALRADPVKNRATALLRSFVDRLAAGPIAEAQQIPAPMKATTSRIEEKVSPSISPEVGASEDKYSELAASLSPYQSAQLRSLTLARPHIAKLIVDTLHPYRDNAAPRLIFASRELLERFAERIESDAPATRRLLESAAVPENRNTYRLLRKELLNGATISIPDNETEEGAPPIQSEERQLQYLSARADLNLKYDRLIIVGGDFSTSQIQKAEMCCGKMRLSYFGRNSDTIRNLNLGPMPENTLILWLVKGNTHGDLAYLRTLPGINQCDMVTLRACGISSVLNVIDATKPKL